MAVKELEVDSGDRLLIDVPQLDKRLLVFVEPTGLRIVSDKCRHRGGPIHLCYRGPDNVFRCPWHDRKILREDVSEDVTGTYYPAHKCLSLVSTFDENIAWPVRVLSRFQTH